MFHYWEQLFKDLLCPPLRYAAEEYGMLDPLEAESSVQVLSNRVGRE